MTETAQQLNYRRNTYILLFLTLLGTIFISFQGSTFFEFWFDEGYSMRMIQHSFVEIWNITGIDVHPPLYYFMLKVYSFVFGSSVPALRVFSIVGTVLTMLLAFYPCRKMFGDRAAVLFLLFVILTPSTQYSSSEIRMYSWVMFFTTAGAMFAYLSFRESGKKNWILFTVFTIAAFYTHYYGAITMVMVYLIFFIVAVKQKRADRIKYLLLSTLAVTLAYAPWLSNLFYQLGTVKEGYWIMPVGINDIEGYITTPFQVKAIWPYSWKTTLPTYGLLLMTLVLFVISYFDSLKDTQKKHKYTVALLFLLAYFLVMAFGFTLSVLVRPVFLGRYMMCSLGLLLLGFALAASLIDVTKTIKKIFLISYLLLFVIHAGYRFYSIDALYSLNYQNAEYVKKYLDRNVKAGDAFLVSHSIQASLGVYSLKYPKHKFYFYGEHFDKILVNFDVQHITSFDKIDSSHERIFVVAPYSNADLKYDVDLDALQNYFDVEEYRTPTNIIIYQLKVKKHR